MRKFFLGLACFLSTVIAGFAAAYIDGSPEPVTFATGAGTSTYAVVAGTSTYSVAAGTSSYSRTGGTSVYASIAGVVPALASTNFGTEGIRSIGSFGGYALDEFFEDTYPRGPSRDTVQFSNDMAPSTNLTVTWTAGDVYDPANGYFKLVSGSQVLTDNAVNYAYWNLTDPAVVKWTTTRPNVTNNIVLGTFTVSFHRILKVGDTVPVGDTPLRMDEANAAVFPSIVVSGLNYFPTDTNRNSIKMSSGIEYHDLIERVDHGALDFTNTLMAVYGHSNSTWAIAVTNLLPIGTWDNGTNWVACEPTNWYRGVFLSQARNPYMHWVLPDRAYTSYVDAAAGNDPDLPDGYTPYIPLCTAYIFQGGDTNLRTEADFWLDRRFMIRRGSLMSGGGGGNNTPTLSQVLSAGAGTGGILPSGMGMPTTDDQAASKGYVDTTINNINYGRAYVDKAGSNELAHIKDSVHPFLTIMAAVNAAAAAASDTNRFIVQVSPGTYNEKVSMSNFVGIVASDIESTRIVGSVTYPPAYTDINGAELQQITVDSSNEPALILNAGDDLAYCGIRSCYFTTTYDNGQSNKSVVVVNRGLAEMYGTTYSELYLVPTNGSGAVRNAQIVEHTTDPANPGLSQFVSFSSSCNIYSSDTNDDISLMYTHDNTDAACINTLQNTLLNVHLDQTNALYVNNVKLLSHKTAQGRSLSMGAVTRLYMNQTNGCNVFFGYCDGGTTDNVTIVRGNHIRMPIGSTSNIWLGAAIGVNDRLRLYDSVMIQNFPDYPYPRIYTNAGALGKFFYNTPAENGDYLFGSALDLAAQNSITPSTPESGHVKIYIDATSGFERPYFVDSRGNKTRIGRDSILTVYNAEATPLTPGEAVYITNGISGTSHYVKRAKADKLSTLPAFGIVVSSGGIAAGDRGLIMRLGRAEFVMDTTMWSPGDALYVSDTLAGKLTNAMPSGNSIAQFVGWCNVSAASGSINVQIETPNTLGGLLPKDYVTNNQTSVSFGNVSGNGAGVTNVDAVTLAGQSLDDIMRVGVTYFFMTNEVSYGAVTGRSASLEVPNVLQTSTYSGATNNQWLASYLIPSNQMPALLQKGIYSFSFIGSHNGSASQFPTIKGVLCVKDATTGISAYEFDSVTSTVPRYTNGFVLTVSVTNDIPRDGYAFQLNTRVVNIDGVTNLTSYFGKPYYPGFTFPLAGEVYVPYYVWNGDKTNRANLAYENVFTGNTNRFNVIVANGSGISNITYVNAGLLDATNKMQAGDLAGSNYVNATALIITNAFKAGDTVLSNVVVSVSNYAVTVAANATNGFQAGDLAGSNYVNSVALVTTNAFRAGDTAVSNLTIGVSNYANTVAGNATNGFQAGDLAGSNYVNSVALVTTNAFKAGDTAISNLVMTLFGSSRVFISSDALTNSIAATETTIFTITNAPIHGSLTNYSVSWGAEMTSSSGNRMPTMSVYWYTNAAVTNAVSDCGPHIITQNIWAPACGDFYLTGITNNVVILIKQRQLGGGGNSLSRRFHLTFRAE